MPSGLCHQCAPPKLTKLKQIKQVKMYVEQRDQSVGCDDHDGCLRGPCKVKLIIYLCAPCARELGYAGA